MRDYKSIQVLASISLIGGPLSLLFGGVLLSAASLVCGIIAMVMLRGPKVRAAQTGNDAIEQSLTRQAIIGLAVSGIALVLNAVALASIMPALLDAMRNGDYSSLLGGGSSDGSSSSGSAFDSKAPSQGGTEGRSYIWG